MKNTLPQDIIFNNDNLKEYLKTDWIIGMMLRLEQARKDAGLTQGDLAQKLNRQQSVVSRTERDLEGSISLSRYADWLFACDAIPSEIEIMSLDNVRQNLLRPPTNEPQTRIEYGEQGRTQYALENNTFQLSSSTQVFSQDYGRRTGQSISSKADHPTQGGIPAA